MLSGLHSKCFPHSLPFPAWGLPVYFLTKEQNQEHSGESFFFFKQCCQPKQKGRKSQTLNSRVHKITLKGIMGFYMQSKSIKRLRKCRRTSWEEGQENELLGATPKVWPIQGDTGRLDSLELKKKKSVCMTDEGMKRKNYGLGEIVWKSHI